MTTIPAAMTVIGIKAPGGPDMLVPMERPVPQPGDGEILVKVAAAGVNRPDVMQRMGNYPPPPGVTDIPGLEIAGTVVARGAGATRWQVGDTVTALVSGGGYAPYCTAHETHALPLPQNLSVIAAAAIPETFFTVWHNAFERGGLKPGETLLVHGGSSGIGTTAIQLAKALGSRVITTAGSAEKCDACRRIGADVAINYRSEDFVAVTGRIVQIAFQGSPRVTADIRRLMFKRLHHTGSTLRARPVPDKAAIARAVERSVWPLIAAGKVKPVIDSTFPLHDAAKAHARMESSVHIGKIVLVVP
jgi:NADPH2:quinone reductase